MNDRLHWARESGGTNARNLNNFALDAIQGGLRSATALLDVGCGQGELGRLIRSRFGHKADAIDIVRHDQLDPDTYRRIDFMNLDALTDCPGRFYDVIFAVEVIEHLECPRRFIRHMASWLRPDGRLVVTTPNIASLTNIGTLLVAQQFRDFRDGAGMYPCHISPILAEDLCRMMRESDLLVDGTSYCGRGRIPFAVRDWQSFLPMAHGRLFSDNVRIVGRRSPE